MICSLVIGDLEKIKEYCDHHIEQNKIKMTEVAYL